MSRTRSKNNGKKKNSTRNEQIVLEQKRSKDSLLTTIIDLLKAEPLKASDISSLLKCRRKTVNQLLYGMPDLFVKSDDHLWSTVQKPVVVVDAPSKKEGKYPLEDQKVFELRVQIDQLQHENQELKQMNQTLHSFLSEQCAILEKQMMAYKQIVSS